MKSSLNFKIKLDIHADVPKSELDLEKLKEKLKITFLKHLEDVHADWNIYYGPIIDETCEIVKISLEEK